MVYCGKPSKGCSSCRERKIRCDQKEPSCGQCEKRQQTCPGYRNLVDLMFRDESNHVIKKATKKSNRGRRPKPAQGPPPDPDAGFPSAVGIGSSFLGFATGPSQAPASRPEPTFDAYPDEPEPEPSMELLPPAPSSLAHRFRQPPRPPGALFHAIATATRSARRREMEGNSSGEDERGYNSSSDDEPPASFANSSTSVILRYMPSRSLQEQGTALFFSRYVATDSGCYENYNFIYDVWRPPSPHQRRGAADDCVTASMTAVGLACLSKLTRSKDTMMVARQSYGAALSLTNKALRDPVKVVDDKTFLAVLILGTYEFVAGQSPQTVRAWQEHVNGAAALARLRGATQFRSTAGTKMFLMLCHSLLISCIEMDLPMPQALVDLRKELGQLIKSDTFTWQVVDTIYKGLQIRYDIKIGKLVDLDETIQRLVDVEDEFDILVRRLPRWWRYRRGELVQPHEAVMGRTCHLYSTFTLATTWNGMRTIRLLVQETIIDKLCSSTKSIMSLSARYQLQLSKAVKLQQLIGEAVIASVPQHFGVVSFRDIVHDNTGDSPAAIVGRKQAHHLIGSNLCGGSRGTATSPATPGMRPTLLDPTQSKTGQECDAERFMTLATASHTIIWPLYTLGLCSATSTEMKEYAVSRLNAIWYETGLDQARTVAQMVQDRFEVPLWERVPIANLPEVPASSLATVF